MSQFRAATFHAVCCLGILISSEIVFGAPGRQAGPLCGNGIVDAGEPCDDGNASDFDFCSSVCTAPIFAAIPSDDVQPGLILRLLDRNGDNDADDPGEQLVYRDGGGAGPHAEDFLGVAWTPSGAIYTIERAAARVLRLADLNGDGDAQDAGEAVVFRDGSALGGKLELPASIGIGFRLDTFSVPTFLGTPREVVYVMDVGAGHTYRLEDQDGDGQAQAGAELCLFHENIPSARLTALQLATDQQGRVLAAHPWAGEVVRLFDFNDDCAAQSPAESCVPSPCAIPEPQLREFQKMKRSGLGDEDLVEAYGIAVTRDDTIFTSDSARGGHSAGLACQVLTSGGNGGATGFVSAVGQFAVGQASGTSQTVMHGAVPCWEDEAGAGTSSRILQHRDLNQDDDLEDPGEIKVYNDGTCLERKPDQTLFAALAVETTGVLYAFDEGRSELFRLEDLNADRDAMDGMECTVFASLGRAAAGLAGPPVVRAPTRIEFVEGVEDLGKRTDLFLPNGATQSLGVRVVDAGSGLPVSGVVVMCAGAGGCVTCAPRIQETDEAGIVTFDVSRNGPIENDESVWILVNGAAAHINVVPFSYLEECSVGNGDIDLSGFVDLRDVSFVPFCATAPCPSVTCLPRLYTDALCAIADDNNDGDVDLLDFGGVSLAFGKGGCCGDGVCSTYEDCEYCPDDCGECPPPCGDGCCEERETCVTCAEDCGGCLGSCCLPAETIGCEDENVQSCVCAIDPTCCDLAWDSTCAVIARNCGSCNGNCCASHSTPGCSQSAVTECVCENVPACCFTSWTSVCVDAVDLFGCGSCVPNLPPTVQITNPPLDTPTSDPDFAYTGFDERLGLYYADVTLAGSGNDPETGPLSGASLAWRTNRGDQQPGGSTTLGTGTSITVRLYSDSCFGTWHTITLRATDAAGNSTSAIRRIFIWTLC